MSSDASKVIVEEGPTAGSVQVHHQDFPEILAATGGGVLCEPDDPASLAEAVEELLLDPGRAHALGEQGQRAVQAKFTVERMAREVLAAASSGATGRSSREVGIAEGCRDA